MLACESPASATFAVSGLVCFVILSKPLLRSEEPVPSEVEGIWESRAKLRR